MRRKQLTLVLSAAVLALGTSTVRAQVPPPARTVYLDAALPGTTLTDARYTDLVSTSLTPESTDLVFFGDDGTATLSGLVTADIYRLRIGHEEAAADGNPVGELDYKGTGVVTVSGGANLNLIGGDSGTANSGLTVGNIRSGTLVIDGEGSTVTSSRLVVIGTAPSQASRSGRIQITNGGSLVVTAGNINLGLGSGNGMQGHLEVAGNVTMSDTTADLNIGQAKSTSSYTQTSGAVIIGDVVEVGANGSGVIDPLDLSRSKFTFNISGGTFANGSNFFVGRGASIGATFTMTGGDMTVGRPDNPNTPDVIDPQGRFLMGGQTASAIVANHSGGTLNTILDVRVGDASTSATSDSTYNLSGTGVINSATGGHVGRQGIGKFFQTGGTANFNGTFNIGNRETATGANDGLYEISAGDLNISGNLSIAASGIGQFRVLGDDATIDVAGAFSLNTGVNGNGTLAYKLESGDSLSRINVVGAATFAAGTSLVLDSSLVSPTQTSYDLLSAASITDSGLLFSGPASWTHQIVSGGLGQILRISAPGAAQDADFDQDGDVDGADFLTWQRNLGTNSGATLASGDANDDDAVNGADLDVWKGQFGPSSIVAGAAVPEPAAAVLLLTSIATVAAWRRRRRA